MLNVLNLVTCGEMTIEAIIPNLVSGAVTILKIAVPIILIIYGMLDLAKAVMSNDEKTMKEAQGKLIKRIIYAVLVFLIVAIVQTVFALLAKADDNTSSATACIDCFMSGAEHCKPAK